MMEQGSGLKLKPDHKPFHRGNSCGVTMDIGKGHRK